MRRAIFLDRDGTINVDFGYVCQARDWRFMPGAVAALAGFKRAGWLLVVVSNQSGIGRGYYGRADVDALHSWVNDMLKAENAAIDAWYYCPHLPDAGCQCRKPAPELLLRAALEWRIDLPASWMLGDKMRDVQAGLAAGCQAGIIGDVPEQLPARIRHWPDLLSAMRFITGECVDPAARAHESEQT